MTKSSGRTFSGRGLSAGRTRGPALVLSEPLSFWGGVDPASGTIVDAHHPQRGAELTGRVVVMPGGRGSSSSSSVLAECVRARTAPAALILAQPDAILAVGAFVARELYGRECPIVLLHPSAYTAITTGALVDVRADAEAATVRVEPA